MDEYEYVHTLQHYRHSYNTQNEVLISQVWQWVITDPWFVPWLDYPASHLVRNIRNMRCEDRAASLFSGEHVLSHGIYVVGL